MSKWLYHWQIESSSSDKVWTVAADEDGQFGCDCPVWKFKRQECKHIQHVVSEDLLSIEGWRPSELPVTAINPSGVTRKFTKRRNDKDGFGGWVKFGPDDRT